MPFSPTQTKALLGWTEQRDTLLREIGVLSVEKEALEKGNIEKGLASTDLDKQISESRGRLAEIEALEIRWRNSISTDISTLEVRKTRLEGECALLEEKVKSADEKYGVVTLAIVDLQRAHDTMKDQSAIVDRVVGEIIQTSKKHLSDTEVLMSQVRTVALEVIDKSNKNIAQADITLNKLTMHIVDNQRPIPVRRQYPLGHPRYVAPENPQEAAH